MYTYPIEQCDVHDKERLCIYRDKRRQWLAYFDDDPHHAIWPHIGEMLWRDHIFKILNNACRAAHESPSPAVGVNGAVWELLTTGFVTTQTTTIRRLVTDNPSGRKCRDVVSLRRIIRELKETSHIVTRESYVCYDGLPYDYQVVHDAWLQKKLEEGHKSGCIANTGPDAWPDSERAHEQFDKLAGVMPHARSRNDTIRSVVFGRLDAMLEECKTIATH